MELGVPDELALCVEDGVSVLLDVRLWDNDAVCVCEGVWVPLGDDVELRVLVTDADTVVVLLCVALGVCVLDGEGDVVTVGVSDDDSD